MTLLIEDVAGWPRERLAAAWPSIIECAQRFVAEIPDEVTLEYLFDGVASGRSNLWVVFDEADPNAAVLAVFTELRHYLATGVNFVEVTGIGGERIREALPLLDEIERWARQQGARKMNVIGRFGWMPLLADRGYRKRAVVLAKKLEGV